MEPDISNIDTALAYATDLCKHFEGLHLEPYHDPVGFPTVGYGTLLSREKWADLGRWGAVTPEEAEWLLRKELERCARGVLRLTNVQLEDEALGALTDFCYNLGLGAYQMSALRRLLNAGQDAAPQFDRWVYAGGRRLQGLVRRRKAERLLFEDGIRSGW